MTIESPTDAWASEFREPLRRFLAKRAPVGADVDDLVQDVFLRLAERPDAVARVGHVRGYLHRAARNALVDLHRKRRSGAASDDELESLSADLDEVAGHSELASCLTPLVERLPAPYRDAIRFVEVDGLTHGDAARRMGASLASTKSRVRRGRERLRSMLLDCCHVALDRRGRVTGFSSRRPDCACRADRAPLSP